MSKSLLDKTGFEAEDGLDTKQEIFHRRALMHPHQYQQTEKLTKPFFKEKQFVTIILMANWNNELVHELLSKVELYQLVQ